MTENEQIREMARDAQINAMAMIIDDNHGFLVSSVMTAAVLYDAGYRKVERGYWMIERGSGRVIGYKCSVCNGEVFDASNGDTDFCPNCGADMRGEKE